MMYHHRSGSIFAMNSPPSPHLSSRLGGGGSSLGWGVSSLLVGAQAGVVVGGGGNREGVRIRGSFASAASHVAQKLRSFEVRIKPFSAAGRRYKTELCAHYAAGGASACPFGDKCSYAHGEDELELTTLLQLHRAGMCDAETYRTRPCLSWVSTGACPFGQRCHNIHDPRVEGDFPAWLTHSEMPSSHIPTEVHVNNLHHKRLESFHHGSPLGRLGSSFSPPPLAAYDKDGHNKTAKTEPGETTAMKSDESRWRHFYDNLCNIGVPSEPDASCRKNDPSRGDHLSERHRIEIALLMRDERQRQGRPRFHTYQPQHLVRGELCMVLQVRAFLITSTSSCSPQGVDSRPSPPARGKGDDEVRNISLEKYRRDRAAGLPNSSPSSRRDRPVLVHEIAFGSDGQAGCRPVSLWFDLDEFDVTTCAPGMARRIHLGRRRRASRSRGDDAAEGEESSPPRSTDHRPLRQVRSLDDDAHDLVTAAMVHRLRALRVEEAGCGGSSDRAAAVARASLDAEKLALRSRFLGQARWWGAWSWPVSTGRGDVDEGTGIPPVSGEYRHPGPSPSPGKGSESSFATEALWGSFVDELWKENFHDVAPGGKQRASTGNLQSRRLSMLRSMSNVAPTSQGKHELLPLLLLTNKSRTGVGCVEKTGHKSELLSGTTAGSKSVVGGQETVSVGFPGKGWDAVVEFYCSHQQQQ